MPWKESVARQRIQKALDDVPNVDVDRFADQYLPRYLKERQLLEDSGKSTSPPLFKLPKNKAVLVDTVQIYITLTNYDEYRLAEGRETEASHKEALSFLHLYYSACDRVAEKTLAQRIDFHGARMHAAILDRAGTGVTADSVAQAFEFVREFRAVAEEANKALANSNLSAQFRVGIDVGRCVAINNGTGSEQEPMFLGSAANHAAKLAAGVEPGVYVSDRVRALIDLNPVDPLSPNYLLNEDVFGSIASRVTQNSGLQSMLADGSGILRERVLQDWQSDIREGRSFDFTQPVFSFSHKSPPLSDTDFADVSPSRSIRMPLLSTYADIDGFTDYIDACIDAQTASNAVRALFVIRSELQAVVEEDFGGKKVRFIGDCIQAISAEGNNTSTNAEETVKVGASCAGALRSSFDLCKTQLEGTDQLGLAIGLELGITPVSKIGIQGERAVRVASSSSTIASEQLQASCNGDQTRFGEVAKSHMSAELNDLVDQQGFAFQMSYDDVDVSHSSVIETAPVFARAHAQEPPAPRAHFQNE